MSKEIRKCKFKNPMCNIVFKIQQCDQRAKIVIYQKGVNKHEHSDMFGKNLLKHRFKSVFLGVFL